MFSLQSICKTWLFKRKQTQQNLSLSTMAKLVLCKAFPLENLEEFAYQNKCYNSSLSKITHLGEIVAPLGNRSQPSSNAKWLSPNICSGSSWVFPTGNRIFEWFWSVLSRCIVFLHLISLTFILVAKILLFKFELENKWIPGCSCFRCSICCCPSICFLPICKDCIVCCPCFLWARVTLF